MEEDILGEIVEWKGPPIRGARSHAGRCLPFGGIRVEGRREVDLGSEFLELTCSYGLPKTNMAI